MKTGRRFWLIWTAGALLWTAAMALAGPSDLRLSLAMVNTKSDFGWLVSRFGEWPGWALVLSGVFLLVNTARHPENGWRIYRPLAWSVLILAACQAGIVTALIKYFWGRVRFAHLDPNLTNYTPFWIPAGVGVGKSFPSGHTAMAFVCAPLPYFFFTRRMTLAGWLSLAFVLVYGGGVAWGRIVYGSHFLTDTLFSAGLALLAAPLVLKALNRKQNKKKAPTPKEPPPEVSQNK